MHENRKTSDVSASSNSRTAGEGLGRNARVYALEESDSGIVPMNHSNKVEHSTAESVHSSPEDWSLLDNMFSRMEKADWWRIDRHRKNPARILRRSPFSYSPRSFALAHHQA